MPESSKFDYSLFFLLDGSIPARHPGPFLLETPADRSRVGHVSGDARVTEPDGPDNLGTARRCRTRGAVHAPASPADAKLLLISARAVSTPALRGAARDEDRRGRAADGA